MGLYPTDSIPRHMSHCEVYERIFDWYRANSDRALEDPGGNGQQYIQYIHELPAPETATGEQMNEVFKNVIMNQMEWAYHEKDEHGYKMAAYAHAGMGTK